MWLRLCVCVCVCVVGLGGGAGLGGTWDVFLQELRAHLPGVPPPILNSVGLYTRVRRRRDGNDHYHADTGNAKPKQHMRGATGNAFHCIKVVY